MQKSKRTYRGDDYEIINGKPHLGLFFGSFVVIHGDAWAGNPEHNPIFSTAKERLSVNLKCIPSDLESRYIQLISRPPLACDPLSMHGTLGLKYMIWGRAFKVMRLVKKGVKRYKKVYICGKRKRVRIDR